jgi:hypothetical protein
VKNQSAVVSLSNENRRLQVGVTLMQGCDYVNAKFRSFIAIRLPNLCKQVAVS